MVVQIEETNNNVSERVSQDEYMTQKRNKINFGFPSTAPIHFDLSNKYQSVSLNMGIKPTKILVRKTKR